MNLEEAQRFLGTKRSSRGRPPKEWTLQKIEAEKTVRAATSQRAREEIQKSLMEPIKDLADDFEDQTIKIIDPIISQRLPLANHRDQNVAEAFDSLAVASKVEW